jgi:sugar/nucleoside kinase (ribokinase family)
MDHTEHKDIEELINAGKEWYQSHGCPIFLTLANQGCLLYQEAGCMHIPTIEVPPPIDPVGAGDTFLASLTSGLVGGLSPEEAVFFANLAASVSIQKIGITGTATMREILLQYDNNFSETE